MQTLSPAPTTAPSNGFQAQEETRLHQHLHGQQALLRLALSHEQYPTKGDLLQASAQLALEMTSAEAVFMFFRQKANPLSERVGESVCFRLVQQLSQGPFLPDNLRPLDAVHIEAVGKQTDLYLDAERRHLLAPLHRGDKVMAVLDMVHGPGKAFDETDVALIHQLLLQLNAILQSRYLIAAHASLVQLAQDLSAELDLATLLNRIAAEAANIANAQASSILLIQPQGDTMRFAAVYGLEEDDREMLRQLVVPLRSSLAGSVALTGKPLVSNDVAQDPRFYAGVSNSVDMKTRSLLAVPLIAQDKAIGALEVVNQKYDDGFDPNDVEILRLFATQAAIAIQNARLLAERQESLAEMTKLEQRKSQFIALASHELRTPLNLVSGYATLLRAALEDLHVPPDHEAMDCLEQIDQATARLTGMVSNITSMYNLETGRTQLLLERKDVVEVIEQVVAEYREWSKKKGIQLRFERPGQPAYAICDPLEVNRILGNLVNNAVKFTPEGGQITVSVGRTTAAMHAAYPRAADREEVLISVADTGPGIEPSQLETIFERFAQIGSHLNRVQGGIGLGLPLAKALVEKHGGALWVESMPGAGSTFRFTLPAAR